MNAITRVSAKGQVVIPKEVRDRLRWKQGMKLEVIDGESGVMLRAVERPTERRLTVDESLARMHAISNYKGPRGSDAEWTAAIDAMFAAGEENSF